MSLLNDILGLFRDRSEESSDTGKTWLLGCEEFERGREHFAQGRYQEAVACFDVAVVHGFENVDLLTCRGSCLQEIGWHLDAIDDFTKAIALDPDDCNTRFMRAVSRCGVGNEEGSQADFRDAIHLSQVESELNREYDLGAKEMGHLSAAAMYALHAEASAITIDEDTAAKIDRANQRGRRGGNAQ